MKIFLKGKFRENIRNLIRRCGYGEFIHPKTGQVSYFRKLSRGDYPQFHLYIQYQKEDLVVLNLHLDQKKPSYPGFYAHSAEYGGKFVQEEGQRIERMIERYRV